MKSRSRDGLAAKGLLDSTQSYYHYLFVVRVASFAPERSKGANDVSLLSIHKAKSLYASEF